MSFLSIHNLGFFIVHIHLVYFQCNINLHYQQILTQNINQGLKLYFLRFAFFISILQSQFKKGNLLKKFLFVKKDNLQSFKYLNECILLFCI